MARKTKEELAAEAKLKARRERRARRKASDRAAEAEVMKIDSVSDAADGEVDETVLGRKQQSIAASESPKVVRKARDQLAEAFIKLGDVDGLTRWGRKNPTEFYRIWARMITPEKDEGDKVAPLETLLAELAKRPEMPVNQAAIAIGEQTLRDASGDVDVDAAIRAFEGTRH